MGAPSASSAKTPHAGAYRESDRTGTRVALANLGELGGQVGDRPPDSGVAVWIALRRAHQGGVTNLASHWLDAGRPVPGYVADALDGLTSAGLLALADADPESGGLRRVTVTDIGCTRYVALCQIHNRNARGRASVSTPWRWALSPYDQRSHLLAERGPDQIGVLVAVCGHRMLWSVATSAQPSGRRCPTCQALADVPIPAPQFGNSPDSGRPPAEQLLPPPLAPGGRPDPTTPAGSARLAADAARGDLPRDAPGTGPVVVNPCVQLPVTRVDPPVAGPSLQLVFGTLVLQRAHTAEPCSTPRWAALRVPDPQFPTTTTPADHRLRGCAPEVSCD